jgi:predicted DNA-binding protein (MmcQ/YjbR family)
MRLHDVDAFCRSLPHATSDQPFGPGVIAYRLADKIFALVSIEDVPPRINLKCEPELAIELRELYECVVPGYHMNKVHWNTVILDGSVQVEEVRSWITHSYDRVRNSLTSRIRHSLEDDRDQTAGPGL